MTIQFNTDKTVDGDQRTQEFFTSQISKKLKKYQSHITRIEVHLSDEKGNSEGLNDIRCLLEARLEGKQPIAVSNQANNIENSISGALNKLTNSLDSTLERY